MTSDFETIMENLVRIGVVSSVDSGSRRARVIFKDKNMVSDWLYVLQLNGANVNVGTTDGHSHSASLKYWMPKVNDSVLCLYIPVFNGAGFILGGISS